MFKIPSLLNNEINTNEITKEEENKLYNKILKGIEKRFTSMNYDTFDLDNGIDTTLKAEKLIITFTTIQNQKSNTYNNTTIIDLEDCETSLRNYYNLTKNETIYIKKIDKIQDGMKALKVEYDTYVELSGNNLINLNLTVCENNKISIFLDKYNQSSQYYNDIC